MSLFNVIGAAIGARSADKAADSQAASADAAIGEQRRQFDLTRADFAPWRQVGGQAINRAGGALGLGGVPRYSLDDDPILQSTLRFGLDEGTKAISRMARARGMFNSGATGKALARFTTDYVGQKQGEAFNRLLTLGGVGQQATGATAAAGANATNNIGEYIVGAGNARGAASIAQGNAWSGALQNTGNQLQRGMFFL